MMRMRDYLSKLSSLQASELLLSANRPPLFRTLNEWQPVPGTTELRADELERALTRLLSSDELRMLREEQHVSCIKELDSGERVRAYCHASNHGYTVKLVLLSLQAQVSAALSIPPLIMPLTAARSGLIVITGPAGSGKTTLLSRILAQVAGERHAFAATIEDPVQYSAAQNGAVIMQRAVGRHCASHAHGIETALSARAEVIACSNLAAPHAFARMLDAASCGVLAVAELRAHSAVGAIEQLLGASVAALRPLLARELSECLLAVISLDLLPAKSGEHALALEVLTATPKLCGLLKEQDLEAIPQLYEAEPGMQSMDRSLLELATAGILDGREAYRRATDKTLFSAWA
ncbi:MAG TPA: ATPase, T2SS/T4P/T4SS family [Polyangiales bacterium]|jgi:twitching motility protein PilT|nr:ATPase, T2SS/T4P/T4SS family [Polyangiales bacterium]